MLPLNIILNTCSEEHYQRQLGESNLFSKLQTLRLLSPTVQFATGVFLVSLDLDLDTRL